MKKPSQAFNAAAITYPLHDAAAGSDLAKMAQLLTSGNVNARDAEGRTPLMIAAKNGHADAVCLLLKTGADVHATDNQSLTALNHVFPVEKIAQKLTSEPLITGMLLEHGADACAIIGGRPENTGVVAEEVIKRGMTAMLARMLDQGLNVNSTTTVSTNVMGLQPDAPLLVAAADAGNKAMMSLLIARGARVNDSHKGGRTALRSAIAQDDLEMVNMMLDAGADTGASTLLDISGKRMTDLEFSKLGKPEIAAVVIAAARKFEVNHAAFFGNAAKLEELLKDRLPVETVDITGYTPLQHAIRESRLDAVKVLIKYGAKLDHQREGHNLPLHTAIRKGDPDVLRALLEAGASTILKSHGGKDARDVALKIKNHRMWKVLESYYAHEKGIAVKQAIGLNGSVAAPQTARFRKGPTP